MKIKKATVIHSHVVSASFQSADRNYKQLERKDSVVNDKISADRTFVLHIYSIKSYSRYFQTEIS